MKFNDSQTLTATITAILNALYGMPLDAPAKAGLTIVLGALYREAAAVNASRNCMIKLAHAQYILERPQESFVEYYPNWVNMYLCQGNTFFQVSESSLVDFVNDLNPFDN